MALKAIPSTQTLTQGTNAFKNILVFNYPWVEGFFLLFLFCSFDPKMTRAQSGMERVKDVLWSLSWDLHRPIFPWIHSKNQFFHLKTFIHILQISRALRPFIFQLEMCKNFVLWTRNIFYWKDIFSSSPSTLLWRMLNTL